MYIPYSQEHIEEAFDLLNINSFDDLFSHIRADLFSKPILEKGKSEEDVRRYFEKLSYLNRSVINFAGFGIYNRIIPSVVEYIISRGEFLTSYTPYQAEASQGTLQAIFEYQSLITELTGMDVANASVYDGATALAEAFIMAGNIKNGKKILLSKGVNPFYRDVVKTYMSKHGELFEEISLNKEGITDLECLKREIQDDSVIAFAVQYPNFLGYVEQLEEIGLMLKERDVIFIVIADPIALALLEPPSSFGADIVVGEGQQMGIPMNMGGPGVGFFATKREYVRKLPGRIAGLAEDIEGSRSFTLVLQTREQHIRREKATSNICTNQNLLAIANAIYMSLLGSDGLREIGKQSISKAMYLKNKLMEIGFEEIYMGKHLWEFPLKHRDAEYMYKKALERKIVAGVPLWKYANMRDVLLIAVTEKRTRTEMDLLIEVFSE